MTTESLFLENENGGVLTLTLNRTAVHNALNKPLLDALSQNWKILHHDEIFDVSLSPALARRHFVRVPTSRNVKASLLNRHVRL